MIVDSSPTIAQLLLFFALPPLILSLVLLKIAYLPRRSGLTPHCSKCNYTLTGLGSDRCPECGQPLSPTTTVHGERPRRPILGAVGSLFLLLAIANTAIILAGDNVNWYQYKPTAWVIQDAADPAPALAQKAWAELQRRMQDNDLTESQHDQLTEVALAEQARPSAGPIGQPLLDYLGARAADGKLSKLQLERFVDQGTKFTLAVRERVAKGDPAYYRISYTGRGPASGWWSNIGVKEIRIDGKTVQKGGHGSSGSAFGGGRGALGSEVKFDEPGPHTMEVLVEQTIRRGSQPNPDQGAVFLTRTIPLKADFTVLPDAPPDFIKLVRDKPTPEELQNLIRVRSAVLVPDAEYLNLNLECAPLPIGIAFDVFIRIGDQELKLGTMSLSNKKQMGFSMGEAIVKKFGRPKVLTVILRTSDHAARRSVDLYEIWDGELVFEDFPVQDKW